MILLRESEKESVADESLEFDRVSEYSGKIAAEIRRGHIESFP